MIPHQKRTLGPKIAIHLLYPGGEAGQKGLGRIKGDDFIVHEDAVDLFLPLKGMGPYRFLSIEIPTPRGPVHVTAVVDRNEVKNHPFLQVEQSWRDTDICTFSCPSSLPELAERAATKAATPSPSLSLVDIVGLAYQRVQEMPNKERQRRKEAFPVKPQHVPNLEIIGLPLTPSFPPAKATTYTDGQVVVLKSGIVPVRTLKIPAQPPDQATVTNPHSRRTRVA